MAGYPNDILEYLNLEIREADNASERRQIRKKWQKLVSEEITDRYNANRITNATIRTWKTIDSINVIRYHPYWDKVSDELLIATEKRIDALQRYEKRATKKS